MRQNQRRAIQLLNHIGHRKRLTRPRDAEQNLRFIAALNAFRDLRNRLWLIARRDVIGNEFEIHVVVLSKNEASKLRYDFKLFVKKQN
jgi:hypothetical protein